MIICRLCHANANRSFERLVLNKYNVSYFTCESCGCLQSEKPYWLAEAYASGFLTVTDTGPAVRCLDNTALIFVTSKIFGLQAHARVLDYGGGNGLLTRLLRDQGFDAQWSDAYASNDLARGFEDDGTKPDILCLFEVAEHMAEPAEELARLFSRNAEILIIGTRTFLGQGQDWDYLSPESGQHVFFYSPTGMASVAQKFGYCYTRIGSIHLFHRQPLGKVRGAIFWRLLTGVGQRLVRAYLAFRLSNEHAVRDMGKSGHAPNP
jgi:hypothetical protein